MAFPFFHGVLDVTFRFFKENYGREGLHAYLRWLAENYYTGLVEGVRARGLDAVEEYWRSVFADETAAEPAAAAAIDRTEATVRIEVQRCPAFVWMKDNGREPCECFCDQCAVINTTIADAGRLKFHLSGGRGQCIQVFAQRGDGQ